MSTYRFDGQYPITKKKKKKEKGKKKEKNKKTTHPHFELFFPNRRYTEYVDCSTGKKKNQKTLWPQSFQEQIIGKQD